MLETDARRRMMLIYMSATAVAVTGCHSFREGQDDGPGMMLVYGSVINGRSISVKSATLPDSHRFPNPGSLGGRFKKGETWLRGGVSATMSGSGDRRALPDWVDFEWSEPPYPEDSNMSLQTYRDLPRRKHRLAIRSRIPEFVIKEVVISKRQAPAGKVAEKSLWLYIFWTPDGMKLRWAMRDQKVGIPGGFGATVHEGGDDLDRYNP